MIFISIQNLNSVRVLSNEDSEWNVPKLNEIE